MARTVTPTPRRDGAKSRQRAPDRPSRTPAAPKLYPTKNDLPEDKRVEVIGLLNQRLAEAIDLQSQCKQAHWNVKGPSFIGLHKLFDDVNEDVETYVDLIAERVVQLGGIAEGTIGAVERFESAVEAHGGDLMVDDLKSSRPDDRHFVLPRRGEAESARAYMVRIGGATEALRRHPRHPG